MTTDQTPPAAPRVRAPGPGGFEVKGASYEHPWWRLVGENGEILGHSQVYVSLANARRGVDAAERTVIRNAHECGPTLYDVLREIDATPGGEARPTVESTREVLVATWGPELLSVVEGHLARGDYAIAHQLLVQVAAAAVVFADVLRTEHDLDGGDRP